MRGPYHGKRLLDLALLAVVAVPALVVGVVCAVLVKATSRGPVLFRQTRVGMGGHSFEMVKFRSMVDRPDNPLFPDSDRITRVGHWLRRLSLDEVPQLLNVAAGEMSIVGPRPALPEQMALFTPRQRERVAVRPGLTGLAQVSGRNRLSWSERIECDLEYVERQSAALDLRILARTPAIVLGGSGLADHPRDDPLVSGR